MQYIQKSGPQPGDWDLWFTTGTGNRSYNYNSDASAMRNLPLAKKHLLEEQNWLCAYCQQKLTLEQASIEHVIPKEFNKEQSTNYHNLVAVCKETPTDPIDDRVHCDKYKQSEMIASLIFSSASDVTQQSNHRFLEANSDGSISAKGKGSIEDKKLAEVFIEVLNLNHSLLKAKRAVDHLNPLISIATNFNRNDRRKFWKLQFSNISRDKERPFRMFLLIYIGRILGF